MKKQRQAGVLLASLQAWAKRGKYADLFKKLQKETLEIAQAGLEEIPRLQPQFWAFWWATNHNRYIRGAVTQRELLLLHEIMYQFLAAYTRGDLKNGKDDETSDESSRTTARNAGKQKPRAEQPDRV